LARELVQVQLGLVLADREVEFRLLPGLAGLQPLQLEQACFQLVDLERPRVQALVEQQSLALALQLLVFVRLLVLLEQVRMGRVGLLHPL
jgi:hypothetical protein